jgi:hypothetical protein
MYVDSHTIGVRDFLSDLNQPGETAEQDTKPDTYGQPTYVQQCTGPSPSTGEPSGRLGRHVLQRALCLLSLNYNPFIPRPAYCGTM